jgi:predicted ribosome quality control (RQC) complex YloA/Tae2 family protein
LVNDRNTIIDAFLKKSDVKAEVLDIAPETGRSNSSETLADILTTYEDQPVRTALKRTFQRLGPALVQELLTMSDLNGEESVRNLSKDEIGILEKNEHRLVEELLSKPAPRIYFDGTTPVRFSIIPLIHLKDLLFQNFGSISEGIQTYLAAIHHDKEAKREKEGILKVLKHEYDNSERTLKNISAETELPNLPAQYEKYGKLLMGQLHLFKKGDDIACVEDFSGSSGDIIEIPLDIHLTPVKNAERYFEKAERSKRKLEEQSRRIAELTQKKKSISQLLEKLEDALTTSDLQQFADENRKQLAQFGLKSKKSGHIKKEEPVPFRVFIVAGGFRVWAGKSGENNDLLSTRHTAKNDLWFHARGVGGSHVVLKIGTGKGEVSKQAIEQAAGIAAYYSKMKKSKLVPVTMCQGKYVRKPKGVPPGTVVVEREKTIFAEPGLPQAS